jgi:multidrug efflux pump subunit AcrA (membrane-fusion protein)
MASGAQVALGLLALACSEASKGPQVPVVEVKRTRFARTVDADGYLRAVKSTPVTVPPEAEGPLRLTWLAEDGSRVRKGDVVARFDDLDLKARLAGAQDDQTSAAAKRAKEALHNEKARRDRERSASGAERELEMARAFQRRDSEIFSRDQIIESEIDERLQGAKAEHARAALKVDGAIGRRKLEIVGVEAKKAKDAIERAKKGLERLEVKAPHDGVLVLKRTWRGEVVRVGDTVWRSETVAEVSLVEELEAEVFVLEVEAAGLAKGKKADVRLESQASRVVRGEVGRVETVAKRRQFRSPTQYFAVVLKLDKTDPAQMKPGQRVTARLELDQREALVVPRPALFDKDGRWIAYRREGTGFVPVPVKLGTSTAGLVVIESGLRPNDVIALRDPGQTLEDILAGPPARPARAR